MPEACNFIKKETLAQVVSCEFCEISRTTLLTSSEYSKLASRSSNQTKISYGKAENMRLVAQISANDVT